MKKAMVVLTVVMAMIFVGCSGQVPTEKVPTASSGVSKVNVKVKTNERGRTAEQENIGMRLEEENTLGNVRHLYIISAYSGDVILYSAVNGKVTSSGKRLSPYTVASGVVGRGQSAPQSYGVRVKVGGRFHRTSEVLQDDGTYGHSIPYLYWWDTKDIMHKHYVSGGQIVHISSQPMVVPKVILNVENSGGMEVGQKAEPKNNAMEARVDSVVNTKPQ